MSADYKSKYLNIRAKFMEVADVSFRLGYEQGMKDATMQQMQQQQEQQMQEEQMQQQMMQQGGGEMPMEGQEGMPPEGMPPEGMPPEEAGAEQAGDSSELDQSINELEGLVAKGEKPSVLSMRKAVEELATLRKSQKQKTNKATQANVTYQKNFVDGILKKWEVESKGTTTKLEEIIKEHEKTKE
jgi:hypothetical protein